MRKATVTAKRILSRPHTAVTLLCVAPGPYWIEVNEMLMLAPDLQAKRLAQ